MPPKRIAEDVINEEMSDLTPLEQAALIAEAERETEKLITSVEEVSVAPPISGRACRSCGKAIDCMICVMLCDDCLEQRIWETYKEIGKPYPLGG